MNRDPRFKGLVDLFGTARALQISMGRLSCQPLPIAGRLHGGNLMAGFSQPPLSRDQLVLISTTLDDAVPEDHPVRLFHELLSTLDWSSWNNHYCQVAGQPPIPPMVMAGVLLYGLTHQIRSSRRLEWACKNAVDFMWLAECRQIDHSTICQFRTQFEAELKGVFLQIGRLAMGMGMIRLNQVGLDGTRVKANSSRHSTATAKTLEERLEALDQQINELFTQAQASDQADQDLFGDSCPTTTLPKKLANLEKRQEALRIALENAKAIDAKRAKNKESEEKAKKPRPAKVPVADPDASILPNKEGGFAPNFNPLAAVDGENGMVVDADVIRGASEASTVMPTVDRIEENFGRVPDDLLADTTFGTGNNLSDLEDRGVTSYMPTESTKRLDKNPAERADLTQPVPERDWPQLPRRPQSGKLDRLAFIYDSSADCYYCPMGRILELVQTKTKDRASGNDSVYHVYECSSCQGCPLAGECISASCSARTVSHDQHETARSAAAARLNTEHGQATYRRRAWIAETVYAIIKAQMGLRQFLHRGIDKVRTEWLWACTAFNIQKLMRAVAGLRARLGTIPG